MTWNQRTLYCKPSNIFIKTTRHRSICIQLAGKSFFKILVWLIFVHIWLASMVTYRWCKLQFVCFFVVVLLCHTDVHRAKKLRLKWRAVRSIDITLRSRIHIDSYLQSYTYGVQQGVSFAVPTARQSYCIPRLIRWHIRWLLSCSGKWYTPCTSNKLAKAVTVLTCNCKVRGSNLGRNTDCGVLFYIPWSAHVSFKTAP